MLPQLHRRLLWESLPALDFARDVSRSVGALQPPVVGETWESLLEKLVLRRENASWRPVGGVEVNLVATASTAAVGHGVASGGASSVEAGSSLTVETISGEHPRREGEVVELSSSLESWSSSSSSSIGGSPKVNRFMDMPLPDNYDGQPTRVAVPKGFEWVDLSLAVDAFGVGPRGGHVVPSDMSRLVEFLDANALQDSDEQFKLGWSRVHFERQLECPSALVLQRDVVPQHHTRHNRNDDDNEESNPSPHQHLPPHYIAVQTDGTSGPKNLIAFIAAIPIHLRVWNKVEPFYLVRHLCVHRKMRGHRVARVVVKELSRRVHQQCKKLASTTDCSSSSSSSSSSGGGGSTSTSPSQSVSSSSSSNTSSSQNHPSSRPSIPAIFTLGVHMPFRQLTEFGAFHRTFQYDRFVNAGLHPTIEKKDVPVSHFHKLQLLAPFDMNDLHIVFPFVTHYLERFKFGISYTGVEFAHRFGNRPGYTSSYVLWSSSDTLTRKPIGFFSFSELKYEILANVAVKELRIAYADLVFPANNIDLVKSMLVIAHDLGFDELEIGGNMENEGIVKHEELHFKQGTGRAMHYIHNWLCDEIEPKDWSLSENN